MSDEIARLQNELTQLNAAIAALANLPDAQAALQLQLAHKQVMSRARFSLEASMGLSQLGHKLAAIFSLVAM